MDHASASCLTLSGLVDDRRMCSSGYVLPQAVTKIRRGPGRNALVLGYASQRGTEGCEDRVLCRTDEFLELPNNRPALCAHHTA